MLLNKGGPMSRLLKMVIIIELAICVAGLPPAWAGIDWLKKAVNPINNNFLNLRQTGLNDNTIAAGLKEALRVGIDKTIAFTGRSDGFFTNPEIKITMPERMRLVEKALRAAGSGPKVDEFVLSMNRAAEKAVPLARDIFGNAIMGINFDDAQRILKGGDTAATEYFRGKTGAQLRELFMPVVNQKLGELGVVRRYNDLLEQYQKLPFAGKFPAPDINDYVVRESLDGIFLVLGQQEQLIRADPAARVTDLLREVFK